MSEGLSRGMDQSQAPERERDDWLPGELLMRTKTAAVLFDAELRVLDGNEAFTRLLGAGAIGQLLGRDLCELLGLECAAALRRFWEETVAETGLEHEFRATPPGLGSIWIEAQGFSAPRNGRPCVLAFFRDVSRRKMAERRLTQKCEHLSAQLARIDEANSGKAAFMAKVNHELRTPLNGIIGLSEMLRHLSSARSVPGHDVRRFSESIHKSGMHLLSLVNHLLDLSCLEAGSWSLVPSEVDVGAEIEAAVDSVGPMAKRNHIALENACPRNLSWVLDQRALRQIAINLLSNAVKFSPPDSRVRIASKIRLGELRLQVSDEGPGIPEQERQRVLMPFARGRHADEQRIDGVGLGLSIVSDLLKLHGGRLEIDSEVGRGSTFEAVFPSRQVQTAATSIAAE